MQIDVNSTQVTLETFQKITNSNGHFDTWATIQDLGNQPLTVNSEMLVNPIKGYTVTTTLNHQLSNYETKSVQYFRDDLGRNNSLTEDKVLFFIREAYMLPLEVDPFDLKTCVEWSEMLSETYKQMHLSKRDISNALTIDAMYKFCIASGNFRIFKNLDKIITDAEGDLNEKAYRTLASKFLRILLKQSKKRTPFSKGFSKSTIKWLVSQDLSVSLQEGKRGEAYSPEAYKDLEQKQYVKTIMGETYYTSLYLQDGIRMNEFKNPKSSSSIINEGSGTGNLIKPFNFDELCSMFFYPEAMIFLGTTPQESTRPATNSRFKDVITHMWKMNAAVKPIYKDMNVAFISKLPKWDSYIDFMGNTVPAIDTSTLEGFNALRKQLYDEQTDLYKSFNTAYTQDQFDAMIAENTVTWAGSKPAPAKQKKGIKKIINPKTNTVE